MNHRERLQTVLRGGIPDHVPVAPDFSNMIPARLTGKPFWDLYLYNDPPIWEAYIAAARLFDAAGIPTHVHSCGPERALVKIFAEETTLTVIDPLEVPPMGDCILSDLKRLYGGKLTLKGNLHTTEVILRSTVEDVIAASRRAIDDAAAGGRFILSTGDQCGRDTPDDNIRAMVETARTYGRY